MFQIEVMQPKDFEFAIDLTNTMNWNLTQEEFKFSLMLEPDGCFILRDGAERLGLITCVSYGGMGWFGNLIVTPSVRRKGAGHLLVRRTLQYLQNKGAETVGIYAYPQLESFYMSLGFKPDAEFIVMHNPQVNYKTAASVSRVTMQDLPLLNNLDYTCFGWDRQKTLLAILENTENPAFYIREKEALAGFVAAKVYGKTAELGPLVSKSPEVAQQFLLAALNSLDGLAVSVYLPANQKSLCEILIGLGFVEDFRLIRMFWGKPKPSSCIYMAESLERG
ncbi:MAG: GNAT family N-acetyltransferase [Candidatus Bathyarchaeota archaeon]|nr:GNAT family N-acetyltransferase [Candidatus Bathyarchaeota archaeon]